MSGADVSAQEEHEVGPVPASGAARTQMTIFYSGRVVVLNEFPVDEPLGRLPCPLRRVPLAALSLRVTPVEFAGDENI